MNVVDMLPIIPFVAKNVSQKHWCHNPRSPRFSRLWVILSLKLTVKDQVAPVC